MKKLWPVVGFSLLGVVLWALVSTPAKPDAAQVHGGEVSLVDAGPEGLVLSAWVRKLDLRPGEPVRLFVQFENRGAEPLLGLSIVGLDAPGFERRGDCWARSAPICRVGRATNERGLPRRLLPGEAVTVSGEMRPTSEGVRQLLAEVRWQAPAGPTRRQIKIGPFRVVDPRWAWIRSRAERFAALASDLGFPIMLALFGWFLKRRDDQEAAAAAASEGERKRAAEQAEKARRLEAESLEAIKAQVHQTWNQLLGKHLRDSQQHYLPVVGPLKRFCAEARTKSTDRKTFFYLMLWMAKMKKMADQIGGIHLKTREAEKALYALWNSFRGAAEQRLGAVLRLRGLALLSSKENYAQFVGRISSKTELSTSVPNDGRDQLLGDDEVLAHLELRFLAWANSGPKAFGGAIDLAELTLSIFDFEINRPFLYWYEEMPGKDDLVQLRTKLLEIPEEFEKEPIFLNRQPLIAYRSKLDQLETQRGAS